MGSVVRVKYGNIKIPQEPHIEKQELADGSFRALIYDKSRSEVSVKFSEEKFYDYSSGCYRMAYKALPILTERKLILTVLIIRKSAHNFKIVISTAEKTEIISAKDYDEINEVLIPLFNKKKKK